MVKRLSNRIKSAKTASDARSERRKAETGRKTSKVYGEKNESLASTHSTYK